MQSRSLWHSFGCALAGLRLVLKTQRNARIHLAVAFCVIGLAGWLRLGALQWGLLALTIGVVLAAEMGNTAVEALVDLASPQSHPLAGTAKDLAAGAVLAVALAAVAVGACVLGPPLWERVVG